ncbi:hypothetical protein [Phaeobacter inhibens]|uniref:hypothetical protein n=1 Tax=Phaeobacter inhibens TaxID=221822 RepID=UPI0021A8AFBF|nr:hypothetical protein [Phaeobacter inhibens]UWR96380.1 hypothetical protein K4K99_00840 [Phaeobacter inhibens]
MWEKPTHRKIEGTARPLRVAYLVDLSTCENLLIDEIVAESFSRWSGRRTPIIPASPDGVDPAYAAWLHAFDADIIYSYANLTDDAVALLDEKLAPGILYHHEDRYRDPEGDRRYKIELPIQGLSSLSVLPMYASRRWGFGDKPQSILSFDKYWDGSKDRFIRENFGFISTSFGNGQLADSAPELFACLTLISEEALKNRQYGKSEHARYETDPRVLLEALAEPGAVLPPSQLSELFCHYLEPKNSLERTGVNVVVGDEIADRLVFWNGHNRYSRHDLTGTSSIRVSVEQSKDTEFLRLIGRILDRRGVRDGQNAPVATVRSTSLEEGALLDIAERMKPEGKTWIRFEAESIPGANWAIPDFREARAFFTTGSVAISREPKGQQRSEIRSGRAELPLATPWHLSENYLPPSVRTGQWMVDFAIEREIDHCSYSNVIHTWVLPRRLRIDPFFSINRDYTSSQIFPRHCQRPTRSGMLSASIELTVRQASMAVPDDDDALYGALRDDHRNNFLRAVKDEGGREKPPPPKVMDMKYSDKGRYLLGALQHFDNLPDAFQTLMHNFWRETLRKLGADPSHIDDQLEAEFQKIMARRLRANGEAWEVSSQADRQTVAKEALRIVSQLRRPERYVRYDKLASRYDELVLKFIEENPHMKEDPIEEYLSTGELDASIQYLCERKILFQGHEWQCRNCYNRNWVSISDLSTVMTCNVCQNETPPPVSGGWQFKASGFFVEAYSDHGTEPAIWALWQLAERARRSFFFLPSTLIWFDKFREDGHNDCEIDLLAVVDGETVAVEATTSKTLKNSEIQKLTEFTKRVRPDKLYVVCGADGLRAREALATKIRRYLPKAVDVEVATYQVSGERNDPYLPS